MYVVLEYLTYLAMVTALGFVLFGAAVLGLVVKTGATKLADQAAARIPQIAAKLSSKEITGLHHTQPSGHAEAS